MLLEEEIQQKKFRNEYHKLAVNMYYTYSWLIQRQTEIFKKFSITGAQFNILRILRGKSPEPVNINYLKERMLDKMSDASRIVDKLFKKGLVEREICKSDRRKAEVKITDAGLKLLSEMDKVDNEFDYIFINISKSETNTINNLLDKMRG